MSNIEEESRLSPKQVLEAESAVEGKKDDFPVVPVASVVSITIGAAFGFVNRASSGEVAPVSQSQPRVESPLALGGRLVLVPPVNPAEQLKPKITTQNPVKVNKEATALPKIIKPVEGDRWERHTEGFTAKPIIPPVTGDRQDRKRVRLPNAVNNTVTPVKSPDREKRRSPAAAPLADKHSEQAEPEKAVEIPKPTPVILAESELKPSDKPMQTEIQVVKQHAEAPASKSVEEEQPSIITVPVAEERIAIPEAENEAQGQPEAEPEEESSSLEVVTAESDVTAEPKAAEAEEEASAESVPQKTGGGPEVNSEAEQQEKLIIVEDDLGPYGFEISGFLDEGATVVCGTKENPVGGCGHAGRGYAKVCNTYYYKCPGGDYSDQLKHANDIRPEGKQNYAQVYLPSVVTGGGKQDLEWEMASGPTAIGRKAEWGYRYMFQTVLADGRVIKIDLTHVNKELETNEFLSGNVVSTLFANLDGAGTHLHIAVWVGDENGEGEWVEPSQVGIGGERDNLKKQ